MKKAKKILVVGLMLLLNVEPIMGNEIDPYVVVCDPYTVYEEDRSVEVIDIEGSGTLVNETGTGQKMSETVTRTKSFSFSGSGNAEFSIFKKGIKVSAELSYLGSTTTSLKVEANVDPYSSLNYEYGSVVIESEGYFVTLNEDCTRTKVPVEGRYTISKYVRWFE